MNDLVVKNWDFLSTDKFPGTAKLVVKSQKKQNADLILHNLLYMKSTCILYPLGNDMSRNEIRKHKDMWELRYQ